MSRVGEFGVRDALIDVVVIFRSGANTEVLGGLGSDLVPANPRPRLFLFCELSLDDSSCMSFITGEGLGDRLGGPRIVGANEMRTQFCLR